MHTYTVNMQVNIFMYMYIYTYMYVHMYIFSRRSKTKDSATFVAFFAAYNFCVGYIVYGSERRVLSYFVIVLIIKP